MSLPSLLLIPDRYKATKLYSQLPQTGAGDMEVTRATTATRVNSAGLIEVVGIDVPRMDYFGGGCPSLLLEPTRTNSLLRSNDIANADWAKSEAPTITSNVAISPDGTTNAMGIESTSAVDYQAIQQTASVAPNMNHSLSVFVRKETIKTAFAGLEFFLFGGSNRVARGIFDEVAGTIIAAPGNTLTPSFDVEDYGTYWRFIMTVTDNASNNGAVCQIYGTISVNGTTFSAAVGSRRTIYGLQLEEGATATSYIPTVASTVTRNADIVTLAGATALIGQTAGTMFVEVLYDATTANSAGDQPLIAIGTDINNVNAVLLQGATGSDPNRVIGLTFNGGGAQAVIVAPNTQASGIVKIAYTYTANSFKLFVNGVKVGEDLSGTVPTGGNIFFGHFNASGALFTIRLNAASLEKIVISEAEAIALTTI